MEKEEQKKALVNEIFKLRKQLEDLKQCSDNHIQEFNNEVVDINKFEYDDDEEGVKLNFENTFSIFNNDYVCEILSLNLTTEEIIVEFNQSGNKSFGKCQAPYLSKLYVEYNDFKEKLELISTDLICEDENNGYSGRIFFSKPKKNGEITFSYGSDGYSRVSLCFYIDRKLVKCI